MQAQGKLLNHIHQDSRLTSVDHLILCDVWIMQRDVFHHGTTQCCDLLADITNGGSDYWIAVVTPWFAVVGDRAFAWLIKASECFQEHRFT